MNQQNQDLQDGNGQSEKKTRRTRKDQNDRNYNCGCGKSYLSYPALYTHLKQKHDGKPPEGTSLPGPQGKANSRGRPPKKEDGDQNNKEEEKSVGSNEAVDVLEEILNFLDTIDKNFRRGKNDEWTEDNKLSSIFPIEFFLGKDETEYKAIFEGIKQLEDDPANYIVEDIDPKEEIKRTEMNRIFVLFLNYIAKGVQNEALKEVMIFLCFYRKALNQYGWDALEQKRNNELQQQNMQGDGQNGDNPELNGMNIDATPNQQQYQIDPITRQQEYCQANNGDDSFLICNDLVIEVLPNYFREYPNSNDLIIIGPSDEQLKNAVYIIQHFANWLFANRYTNTKLVIKADDE